VSKGYEMMLAGVCRISLWSHT